MRHVRAVSSHEQRRRAWRASGGWHERAEREAREQAEAARLKARADAERALREKAELEAKRAAEAVERASQWWRCGSCAGTWRSRQPVVPVLPVPREDEDPLPPPTSSSRAA
jgi:hypothetical protein